MPFFIESSEQKVSQCSALLLSYGMIECHDFVHFVNMTVIQLDGSVYVIIIMTVLLAYNVNLLQLCSNFHFCCHCSYVISYYDKSHLSRV